MPASLEVLFTPADFAQLARRDLRETTCVVFDVLRATSSMITALANGAEAILPVSKIAEALQIRRERPDVLLAGERGGHRISRELTGSIDFDLGNSPREFTSDKVRGRTIAMTTTNGTRALRACKGAASVFIGAFLNLDALAAQLRWREAQNLVLVCSGTHEDAAYEDTLAAGALCDLLWRQFTPEQIVDSAQIARQVFLCGQTDLASALHRSRNGRRLLAIPELAADVEVCAQRNVIPLCAEMCGGRVIEIK